MKQTGGYTLKIERMNMDEKLNKLRMARENYNEHKSIASKALDEFKSSDDVYTWNTEKAKEASAEVEALEAEIRAEAIALYKADGNKKPHDKVNIKIMTVFKIVEPARVLAWVKTNLADALIYDEKKIKNYATKIGAVDGTELIEEPQAQIASEL